MSAASYYDKAATQEETSHLSSTSGQQPGPMHSGTQGYGQDMREGMNEQQQQRGVPQEGYNQQSGNGIYNGQEPNMGNTNYAHGAQQMNGNNNNYAQGAQQMEGNGAQGAVADDRDTITKLLDRIEKKFGGDRFNNPENAEKNKELNANILKRVKQVMGMVMQRGPGMLMNMVK
ncbi:hypothetical protein HO133_010430 [Letharia lupina]|uniref:Uncharacterized protein n=1 Tax=Letharia lupina TaxID=560253 RepID=A0A8H6CKP5_9LECA|nr:uncharacterized protein HO133_010430 [Letharia lupina]KAF6225233.1 hypothetical protein HO133_010430 [Letharia lupina]